MYFISIFLSLAVVSSVAGVLPPGICVLEIAGGPAKKQKLSPEATTFIQVYLSLLKDAVSSGDLNAEELESLNTSRGRTLAVKESNFSVVSFQAALGEAIQIAIQSGASQEEVSLWIEMAYAETQRIPTKLKKQRARGPELSAAPPGAILLMNEKGEVETNLQYAFAERSGEVFAVDPLGNVWSLDLNLPSPSTWKWHQIYSSGASHPLEEVPFIGVSESGKYLGVADGETLTLIDTEKGKILWSVPSHSLQSVKFSNAGNWVATLSFSEGLRLFKLQSGEALPNLFEVDYYQRVFQKTPHAILYNRKLHNTDVEGLHEKNLFPVPEGFIVSMDFTPSGQRLIFLDKEGVLHRLELDGEIQTVPVFGWEIGSTLYGVFPGDRLVFDNHDHSGRYYLDMLFLSKGWTYHSLENPRAFNLFSSRVDTGKFFAAMTKDTVVPFHVSPDGFWFEVGEKTKVVPGKEKIVGLKASTFHHRLAVHSGESVYFWSTAKWSDLKHRGKVTAKFRLDGHKPVTFFNADATVYAGIDINGFLVACPVP